ncbi:MAG TPA: NirA family protein [Verrucomicrobia bacterium]|nr:NirA family protein [Verrucomicrobiota bacterium]
MSYQVESPIAQIDGQNLTEDQRYYLNGYFEGIRQTGVMFNDIEHAPCSSESSRNRIDEILIAEERIKREEHPLDSYYRIIENAQTNRPPEKEEVFRFKWNGLFFLTPTKDAFMARLRIPGGQLKSYQIREIGKAAKELSTGYLQVTTRSNLQVRLIKPKDAPEFLQRVQNCGLHTRGSGADNIRNITANPTAGVDLHELMDVSPFVFELSQYILNHREFYDLPRKFNIAYDGGGLIGSVEDTNDIGAKAVRIGKNEAGLEAGIYYRIKLGGATGHKAFANDLGILVSPDQLNKVIIAIVRVFIQNGNRKNRKKARLKHLLDDWSLDRYLQETEKILGASLMKSPLDDKGLSVGQILSDPPPVPHSHVGIFDQKQIGMKYIGLSMPVGQMTPDQLIGLADLSEKYGSGEIRLTVWQNLIIPNIPDKNIEIVKRKAVKLGFDWKQSHLQSGFIACTGNSYCKYASSDTKGHALKLINYLKKRVVLDQPVNVHITGCPHSCAQHYIGDIGLLATKTKISGQMVEGYHIFVGGGFDKNRAIGRQVFNGLSFSEVQTTMERILKGYLQYRKSSESFQEFTSRHDLNSLQTIFCDDY